ncbi:MAG: Transcriptional regulator, AcrR family [uncultured Thermomicrobiales bacterium]|uniref:Transcriptional regulator, AcrR family n=1 Tax=uncultured Thermomicrobiales bacterium TaxID=1645740 RepID=A0A6J4UPG4_9BACT|nr:MAG: Transcriptional regulator, AcrR family [uncultured Thermomicrobiales bacterium]
MTDRETIATRDRIMSAAIAEFAAFGIAGARVDRIAREARVNKSLIYHHYQSKEQLFIAVFEHHVVANINVVPLDASDLPAWAVALYDYYQDDPRLLRLITWTRLERTPAGDLFTAYGSLDRTVYRHLAEAQRAGILVDGIDAADLFSLVVAMAGAWAQSSSTFAATSVDPPADHDRRRAALADTVRRAFCR